MASHNTDGYIEQIENVPYLVRIMDGRGRYYCSGTLVSPRHVVTAAHCIHPEREDELFVVSGANNVADGGGEKFRIEKRIIPQEYSPSSENMDIAVIKLTAEMRGPTMVSVPLFSKSLEENNLVKVSGWNEAGALYSSRLPMISRDKCASLYGNVEITETMVCSYLEPHQSCVGNAGGPVIYEGALACVVSWSDGCDGHAYPDVYTDVNVARKFLNEAMES